jgi:hypothetical protein
LKRERAKASRLKPLLRHGIRMLRRNQLRN